MTDSERKKCHAIIHSAATAAGGVGTGLAQLPMSDNLAIIPIQMTMIASLGKVFGKSLSESAIKAILTSVKARGMGRQLARAASQLLVGWIPGVGNAVNASTAFGITEAIGWKVANDFDKER